MVKCKKCGFKNRNDTQLCRLCLRPLVSISSSLPSWIPVEDTDIIYKSEDKKQVAPTSVIVTDVQISFFRLSLLATKMIFVLIPSLIIFIFILSLAFASISPFILRTETDRILEEIEQQQDVDQQFQRAIEDLR